MLHSWVDFKYAVFVFVIGSKTKILTDDNPNEFVVTATQKVK